MSLTGDLKIASKNYEQILAINTPNFEQPDGEKAKQAERALEIS
jgi:hypothetical protein